MSTICLLKRLLTTMIGLPPCVALQIVRVQSLPPTAQHASIWTTPPFPLALRSLGLNDAATTGSEEPMNEALFAHSPPAPPPEARSRSAQVKLFLTNAFGVARFCPSGDQLKRRNIVSSGADMKGLRILTSCCQSLTLHTTTAFSSPPSPCVAKYFPTGSHASPLTMPLWPRRTIGRVSTGSLGVQMTTFPSIPQDASRLPSGLHSTCITSFMCSRNMRCTFQFSLLASNSPSGT
mmetsp:Transcript_49315/g.119576  ORF Transcript_49315/g.119576 Transcript_49315/m.119576 type:complete len:235 (-) Transcript_49315:516-1220(-)